MPYFTSDEDGMGEELNIRHKGVIFITDGEHTTLGTEFAALKGVLPDDIQGDVATQHDEAESTDPQDALLSELHCQIVILSSTIRYIQHLELRTKRLRQEKTTLEAIRGLVTMV